tara:strand:- start:11038 stop:12015 length:978 start_codon:yes stop_codon:yes gene_type:complete
MQLQKYIKELLFRHECVTVPNFGAFLTHTINVLIQPETGVFTPPRKDVSFNNLLKSNDGILAHYVAKKENVSYEKALRKIEKEVIIWKQRLHTQYLTFAGIGEMRLNQQKKIIFSPFGAINFDLSTFGLSSFIRKSIFTNPINTEEPKPITIMENENKDNLIFTPEENENKRSPIMRYAIIGLIGVSLIGVAYYFGNQYIADEKAKATEMAQKKIKSNVQKATFDLGALSKLDLTLEANTEVIEDTPLAETFYSVIAGSYRSMENAEKKLAQLKAEGFDAAFTEVNPEGLHRVAFGRFISKREALNLYNYIRYALKEEAWYLEEY